MIEPLRKKNDDGTAYFRPVVVEETLAILEKLPIEEVARRAGINDENDLEYVPSECIVHFVRKSKANGDKEPYETLFKLLQKRISCLVPVRTAKASGSNKTAEQDSDGQIQEQVMFKFQRLLCLDRNEYQEGLDFYEIRFNFAIKALRITAQRKVGKVESRRKPLQYDGESLEPSLDIEEAFSRLKNPNGEKENDFLFRSRLHAAIRDLPPDERRVIELRLQDIPIQDKNPEVLTIAELMKLHPDAVHQLRKQAVAKLKVALKEEKVA